MANPGAQTEHMLVRSENLDQLLMLTGEIIVASSGQGLAYRNLQTLFDKSLPVDRETLDAAKDLATTTSDISSNLHKLVQDIRTVNLSDLSFRARRLVRDISRKTGKRIQLTVEGEETLVDKVVAEKLYDPIAHQLRNAVDHGIEDSLTRQRKGKPEEGQIWLRIYNTERETHIEIEDDGAGIDMEKLQEKGVAAGIVKAGVPLSEEDALRLMCTPGISTTQNVSEVSGRGVGMDVVNSYITELGGSLSFTTNKDKGSTFLIKVPVVSAVNIVDALVVRAGNHYLAFPILTVVSTQALPIAEVRSAVGKGEMVEFLDQLLPLHDLNRVLGGKTMASDADTVPVLIVENKTERIALTVSEFFSPQKLVIIPFDEGFDVPGMAGTTILAGRRLGFIVDLPELILLAKGKKKVSIGAATARARQAAAAATAKAETAQTGPQEAETEKKPAIEAPPAASQDTSPEDAGAVEEFTAEIEKMLPNLNETIFVIESDPQNKDQINNAFRLLHTIKGNFIMMGLPKAGETVHAVESVLDNVRAGAIELNAEAMDILMDGASYIEDLIRQSRAGQLKDEPGDAILELSEALLPKQEIELEVAGDVATAEFHLTHEATYRANHYRKRNVPFYQCYVEFEAQLQPSFLVACLIYKRTTEIADVLGTVPLLTDVEKGLMQGQFKMLVASEMPPEKLETVLTDLFTTHYDTTQLKLTRFG